MSDDTELLSAITQGATPRGNEYAWSVDSFPDALVQAEALGYACLGGQFQFRLSDSTCEMYRLSADSKDRLPGESWATLDDHAEVLQGFQHLIATTDFKKEALGWRLQIDPAKYLVFVGYFVTEADLADLAKRRSGL